MAQLIKTTGEIATISPKNGKYFTLDELQKLVGGLVEVVYLEDDDKTMVVNEEGKLLGLPVNEKATIVANRLPWDVIAGDAVVGSGTEIMLDC
jgi:hypothetical protein